MGNMHHKGDSNYDYDEAERERVQSSEVMHSSDTKGRSVVTGTGPAIAGATPMKVEAKELHNLNEQFANYFEKVMGLEAMNKALEAELAQRDMKQVTRTQLVEQVIQKKLGEVYKTIEAGNKQRVAAEMQVGKYARDIEELRRRLEEAEKFRHADQARISSLTAELDRAVKERQTMQSELEALRRQLAKFENEIKTAHALNNGAVNDLKQTQSQLERALLEKVTLENELKKRAEEKTVMSHVFEQEITEVKTQQKEKWSEEAMKQFHNELAKAIQNVRAEFAKSAQENEARLTKIHEARAQQIEHTFGADIKKQQEQYRLLQGQLQKANSELEDLQKRNSATEWQLKETEKALVAEKLELERERKEHASRIQKLTADSDRILSELNTLTTAKRELDAEIGVYRSLLQGGPSGPGLRDVGNTDLPANKLRDQGMIVERESTHIHDERKMESNENPRVAHKLG